MSDDLVERLRDFTEEDAYAMPWTFGAVVREAADELARLRAEVERLQAHSYRLERWLRSNMQKKTANLARAERAEAALSDERAHADALAEWAAEYRQAIIAVNGDGDFAGKLDRVNQAAEWLDDLLLAHRARRQG